jgi:hypothetical protein
VLGVVKQAMGEVIGSAVLAQACDRGGERCRDMGVAVMASEAGASQVALGPLHWGKMPGLVGVQQGKQLADGGDVT